MKLRPCGAVVRPSAAASGWAGWALAHPEFGSSVNPITTRGADFAHHITASPPGFENPAASLIGISKKLFAFANSHLIYKDAARFSNLGGQAVMRQNLPPWL